LVLRITTPPLPTAMSRLPRAKRLSRLLVVGLVCAVHVRPASLVRMISPPTPTAIPCSASAKWKPRML
jgi:hypothetical protein